MRLRVSLAAALVGVALLAAAALARTAEEFELIVDATSLYSIDPAFVDRYDSTAGEILYATCAKLVNNPDASAAAGAAVVPEIARALPAVSADGRVYTFVVRSGRAAYRFNTGQLVTAMSFEHAIRRNLRAHRFSPLLENLAGVKAEGTRLVVRLKRPMPEAVGYFARAEFCAIPPGTPVPSHGLKTFPGAGPYYVASNVGHRVVLRRNPHYRGARPRNASSVVVNADVRDFEAVERAETGYTDYVTGDLYGVEQQLMRKYGVNKGQFRVVPEPILSYLVLNADRPLFRRNPSLRRAVNFAVDRHAIAARTRPIRSRRTDQILPPLMPGYRPASLYPIRGPDFATARRLAEGHTRGGQVRLAFDGCGRGYPSALVDILTYDLAQIGLRVVVSCAGAATGSDIFSWGTAADVGDPGAFLEDVFGPIGRCAGCRAVLEEPYRQRLERLRRAGPAAYAEVGRLADEIMRESAPIVPLRVSTRTYFLSAAMTNVLYNPLHGVDLGALRVR